MSNWESTTGELLPNAALDDMARKVLAELPAGAGRSSYAVKLCSLVLAQRTDDGRVELLDCVVLRRRVL